MFGRCWIFFSKQNTIQKHVFFGCFTYMKVIFCESVPLCCFVWISNVNVSNVSSRCILRWHFLHSLWACQNAEPARGARMPRYHITCIFCIFLPRFHGSGDRQGCTLGPNVPVMGNPYISPISRGYLWVIIYKPYMGSMEKCPLSPQSNLTNIFFSASFLSLKPPTRSSWSYRM